MTSDVHDWLQAEVDHRATEIRSQPPTRREITRRNAETFAAQLAPLIDQHDTTED